MAFNSNYTGEQIEEGIKKSLEALDLNGASVNVEIVDENTPASGTVTKEEGSNRARFDFKIPVPGKQVCFTNLGNVLEIDKDGAFFIDRTMVVICDDSDTLYFINGKYKYYSVIVYCTSSDTQYFLKFDLPTRIFGPNKSIELPVNCLVSVPSLTHVIVKNNRTFFEVTVPNDNFDLY